MTCDRAQTPFFSILRGEGDDEAKRARMRGKRVVDRTSMEERRAAGLGDDASSEEGEDKAEGAESGEEVRPNIVTNSCVHSNHFVFHIEEVCCWDP